MSMEKNKVKLNGGHLKHDFIKIYLKIWGKREVGGTESNF